MKERILNLISVKSIVTILMTVLMGVMLLGDVDPPKELLSLYCTTYGSVMTYYFTRKEA